MNDISLMSYFGAVEAEFWVGLVTVIVAMIGWYQTQRSQFLADKRRFRTDYLMQVTSDFAAGVNRDLLLPKNRDFALAVERALEKIRFVGTKEQVKLVLELEKYLNDKDYSSAESTMVKLFTNLRDELRREFNQEPLRPLEDESLMFVRFPE